MSTLNNSDEQLKLEFEKLKLIYEKTAEHHKYYLSWRQLLLAGYFASASLAFYAMYTFAEKGGWLYSVIAVIIGFLIFALSKIFIQLDKRNSDLYHVCQTVGENIEKEILNFDDKKTTDGKALFFTLSNSFKNSAHRTHSELIERIYNSIGILGVLASLFVIVKFISQNCV